MAKSKRNASGENGAVTHLARDLGFWAALSIGVGTMIGAGIFVLLVPLANPETEQSLLHLSTSLARQREARLRLLHAILGLQLAADLAAEWTASITALWIQKGKGIGAEDSEFDHESVALFRDQAKTMGIQVMEERGVQAEVEVATGSDIAEAIVDAAEPNDLIVMGASNEWSLRQRLFGSIPDQVADQAPGSVLMVRSKE